MNVRFFTFSAYHGKGQVGSTQLRVTNLLKYWPEAELYKYGEKVDVMVFQKVYMQTDYRLHEHLDCIKILDICDPDWLDKQNIVETINAVDAVAVPTKSMQKFIMQLTDKPVRIIKDRHDVDNIKTPKHHMGKLKRLVWFGYKQNVELLRGALSYIAKHEYILTVISNDDPALERYEEKLKYEFVKYDEDTIQKELKKNDACLLPKGNRPEDMFKSNNKTTRAWLAGLPVVKSADEIEAIIESKPRQALAKECYNKAIKEYDCKQSVAEYIALINELKEAKKA